MNDIVFQLEEISERLCQLANASEYKEASFYCNASAKVEDVIKFLKGE